MAFGQSPLRNAVWLGRNCDNFIKAFTAVMIKLSQFLCLSLRKSSALSAVQHSNSHLPVEIITMILQNIDF